MNHNYESPYGDNVAATSCHGLTDLDDVTKDDGDGKKKEKEKIDLCVFHSQREQEN